MSAVSAIAESTFVEGRPALFLTPREPVWRELVRAAGIQARTIPRLTFIVSGFRRGGQDFDVDNLAKPVLEIVSTDPTSVWVRVEEGTREGVLIEDGVPPPAERTDLLLDVLEPRRRSVRPAVPLQEASGMPVLGTANAPIGLEIAFDDEMERIGDFGFAGPVKPLIDSLGTVLGTYAGGPRDYRIKELRIRRGERPSARGARLRLWLL
jgi:hypothetical protein